MTVTVVVPSPVGPWGVVGDDAVISRILMPNERPRASRAATVPAAVARGASQLGEYFAGRRRTFDLPLDETVGTAFQRAVWAALTAIPYGATATYADVARDVGRPRAARAVGGANHANPWPIVVPCHRVVATTGLGGYGGGLDAKRFLLGLERA